MEQAGLHEQGAKDYMDLAVASASVANDAKDECQRIERDLGDAVIYMGTLPYDEWVATTSTITLKTGYMWNISTDFVTTDDFKEGAGIKRKAGTNVARTNDGFWDLFGGAGGGSVDAQEITFEEWSSTYSKETDGKFYMTSGVQPTDDDYTAEHIYFNKRDSDLTSREVESAILEVNEKANIKSHVGMIIHSTTLDTEEKVKNIYGGNTWVKIEGRMLLGQSSSYPINSTGGVSAHTHSVSGISHMYPTANIMQYEWTNSGSWTANYSWLPTATSATTTAQRTGGIVISGTATQASNMPPYKAVYIWERTA